MLSDDQVCAFRRDGVLRLPHVLAEDELERLRAATDAVEREAVAYGRELDSRSPIQLRDDHGFSEWDGLDERKFLYGRGSDGCRVWRRAEGMWPRDPMFRVVTAHPFILAAVEQLLEGEALPSNDSMVVKMPGAGAAVPWHRDPPGELAFAEGRDGSYDFTVDIYLDRSTQANGCLWAIPGSHLGGWDGLDPLDIDIPAAVPLEAEPGDLLLHSTAALHGSPANVSAEKRRTFYVHYRSQAELGRGYWQKSPDWIADQRDFLRRCISERRETGFTGSGSYAEI